MTARLRSIVRRGLEWLLARRGYELVPRGQLEDGYTDHRHDAEVPLPDGAAEALRPDNPRLLELRARYGSLDWAVRATSRWDDESLNAWLDLRYFRGDNSYVWHYRETHRVSRLKYLLFLRYVQARDPASLVETLGEDGLFGCWTHRFPGCPPCSRDLLDSVNELNVLHRELGVLDLTGLRILDIGAGYGRLAHRASQAIPGLTDYCCVDAVPESTFLAKQYLAFRELSPPARVVPLFDIPALGAFDLAVNVHSFSECALLAVDWWLDQLSRLAVPALFVVPNESVGFLSLERDGTRKGYLQTIESVGYPLKVDEPVFDDPAARELLAVDDRFCLFERAR